MSEKLVSSAAPHEKSSHDQKVDPPRSLASRAIDIILWLVVAVVLAFALIPKDSGPHLNIKAAELSLPRVGSPGNGSLQPLPGELKRPLLIKAFASWCGACRRDNALLEDLHEAERSGKIDVVAVSVDQNAAQALQAKNTWPIKVDVLHDSQGAFNRSYQIHVLPTYILIGTDGLVKRVTAGTAGASDIYAWLHASDD